MPREGVPKCGLELFFRMGEWTCPVHGAPVYVGRAFTFLACVKCAGTGEIEDGEGSGTYDPCTACGGKGGLRYCGEEASK